VNAISYFQAWDGVRWFRLVLAVIFLITGIVQGDALAYGMAAFLGIQVAFNAGCCGTSCATDPHTSEGPTDITFEEIKQP
jgi:hypothetical protein